MDKRRWGNIYYNLHPEEKSEVEIAKKILHNYFFYNSSYRQIAIRYAIDQATAKKLILDIKKNLPELFESYKTQNVANIEGFSDDEYGSTVFDRYELLLAQVDNLINRCVSVNDEDKKIKYLGEKRRILKDMLDAHHRAANDTGSRGTGGRKKDARIPLAEHELTLEAMKRKALEEKETAGKLGLN